jgi:hypothetical protein
MDHMIDKFINWYNKIFIAFLALSLSIPASLAQPMSRSSQILRWNSLTVPPGFILSNYLANEMGCSQIWVKQLPEFQARNLHIIDPDVIEPGTVIAVQVCRDNFVAEVADPEPPSVESGSQPAIEVQKNQVKMVEGLEVQKNQVQSSVTPAVDEDSFATSPYLDIYVGFLGENGKEDNIDSSYGLGVNGDLFSFLGYDMRILGSPSVIFLNNEVRFKTSPGATRGVLIVGMGNRVGLKNKDLDRLNKGVDSYSYGGFGIEMKPGLKWRFGLDLTANFSRHFSPTIGVSAQKRLGEDYWLGLYSEFGSSRSTVDDNEEDRRYFTGGLKFSF